MARSNSARCAVTPVTTLLTSRAPGTCRPFGPMSSNAPGLSNSSRNPISASMAAMLFSLVRFESRQSGQMNVIVSLSAGQTGRVGDSVKAMLE
jgi:hypothetical protein